MITSPRTLEALLEALGAETQYREEVLGDLAEEFASRAERDGEPNARRWYRREAIRAVPHLLRSGWHRARRRGLGHLLGVIATAYTGVFIIEILATGIVFGTLGALGVLRVPGRIRIDYPLWQASMVALGTLTATLGGYLAAWLNEEAPLFTAFAFSSAWSVIQAVGLTITRTRSAFTLPMWYAVAVPAVIFLGVISGGILRVRQATRAKGRGIAAR